MATGQAMTMLIKRLLWLSIVVTAGIFSSVYRTSQEYWLALFSVVVGAAWLYLEITNKPTAASLFFVIFLILAVWGSLQSLSAPIMLLGVSTALAAWDLSRFRARIRHELDSDSDATTSLVRNHLQKLGMALCLGIGLGVIPLAISISINFVVLLGVVIVALLILRQSVLSLRPKNRDK